MKKNFFISIVILLSGILLPASFAQDVFYDFSDSSQAKSWETYDGQWGIENGRYYELADNEGPLISATGNYGLKDYTVGAKVMGLATDEDWGIVFHAVDIYNLYSWQYANATLALIKYNNGAGTTLYSEPLAESLNEWQDFKVIIKGNTFECYWNGALKTTVTDSDFPSGKAGVYGWVNWGSDKGENPGFLAFDDFYITTQEPWTVSRVLPTEGYRLNQTIQGIALKANIADGATAAKLTLTETIPAGLTAANIQADAGKFTLQNNVLTWTLENITKPAVLTYDLTAPIDKAYGDILFTCTADDGTLSKIATSSLPLINEDFLPLTDAISFDFNNADQDSQWQDLSGDWGIQNGMYYEFQATNSPLVSVTGDPNLSNYTVMVQAMGLQTGADWGIAFRVQDKNNHYSWQFTNGALVCLLYNKGGRSVLYTEAMDEVLNEWQNFKVEAVDKTLELYWNGKLKTTITDKTLGWGRIGLYGWIDLGTPVADTIGGIVFDDFTAVGPTGITDWTLQ